MVSSNGIFCVLPLYILWAYFIINKTRNNNSYKNAYNVSLTDYLWIPFLDQSQPDKVTFSVVSLLVYKFLEKKKEKWHFYK